MTAQDTVLITGTVVSHANIMSHVNIQGHWLTSTLNQFQQNSPIQT